MKNNSLLKKIRGYQKAPRDRFFLLKDKILTQEELLLYELGIAITDWDRTHIDTYGTFQATNIEMAELLGWVSDSTVSRLKTSLIKKGYFLPFNDKIKVLGFRKWELRQTHVDKQDEIAEMQVESANMQESPSKMQENRSYSPDYSLVSSKGSFSLRSDEEYQKIKEEMGYEELIVDDMKWIDENVKETAGVPS